MFCESKRISPATLAPGAISCMRLRHRKRVDLPHPEGPMMAVIRFFGIARFMSCKTWVFPNQAFRLRTVISLDMGLFFRESLKQRHPDHHARTDANRQDEQEQHKCS